MTIGQSVALHSRSSLLALAVLISATIPFSPAAYAQPDGRETHKETLKETHEETHKETLKETHEETLMKTPSEVSVRKTKNKISIPLGVSRFLDVPEISDSAVISNPTLASFLLHSMGKILITGQNQGQTDLTILDSDGSIIAHYILEVGDTSPESVAVYRGKSRQSVTCAPRCEPSLDFGDDVEYYTSSMERYRTKDALFSEGYEQ